MNKTSNNSVYSVKLGWTKCYLLKCTGGYTDGETPDPIPNSEAKPARPMVVPFGSAQADGSPYGRVRLR